MKTVTAGMSFNACRLALIGTLGREPDSESARVASELVAVHDASFPVVVAY